MSRQELIPHLFRTEFSRITAVLCKLMGVAHLQTAEDIAGDTFLLALETWPYKGVPPNPAAWLYAVARNKAINYIKRHRLFATKVAGELGSEAVLTEEMDIDLSEKNIIDSRLQMLFTICHPAIAPEAQIGLSLRILCGFGIEEIATAMLTSKETIAKRLYRAREKLRQEGLKVELPGPGEINARLDTVLTTLYLLYNEGYYSESQDVVLREDLCLEAMSLAYLLTGNELTDQPRVSALLSLMCFHASRFAARKGENGTMILYHDQDETLWDKELIEKGVYFLNRSSRGDEVSRYHIEASIAWWHTHKEDTTEKWESILQLFNRLLQISYSPVAALNRTYALAKARGKYAAIAEAGKLGLEGNHYYHALLGELYTGIDHEMARQQLHIACTLAITPADRQHLQRKLEGLGNW